MEFSWIQRHALLILLRQERARAVELCPPDVAANLFAYHLDRLIASGYVAKVARGAYSLTIKGQKLAGSFSTATHQQTENIKTVVMLYSKRRDQYLLFRWSRQPYLGKVTPLYDRMPVGKSLSSGIESALHDKLGGDAPAHYRSSALVKIMCGDELISHMNAYIYEVQLDDISLPLISRNGTAFVEAHDPAMMDGVKEFLHKISHGETAFESIWRY